MKTITTDAGDECPKTRASAQAEFDKECAPARLEYQKECAASEVKFDKTCEPFKEKYDKTCADFNLKTVEATDNIRPVKENFSRAEGKIWEGMLSALLLIGLYFAAFEVMRGAYFGAIIIFTCMCFCYLMLLNQMS